MSAAIGRPEGTVNLFERHLVDARLHRRTTRHHGKAVPMNIRHHVGGAFFAGLAASAAAAAIPFMKNYLFPLAKNHILPAVGSAIIGNVVKNAIVKRNTKNFNNRKAKRGSIRPSEEDAPYKARRAAPSYGEDRSYYRRPAQQRSQQRQLSYGGQNDYRPQDQGGEYDEDE
jgi:hypothetical protein